MNIQIVTRIHYYKTLNYYIKLVLLITVYSTTNNAQAKKNQPCVKQDLLKTSRLFQIVFDTYVEINKQDHKSTLVHCPDFTSLFTLTHGTKEFEEMLSFHKVTVDALSRLDKIHNVTSRLAGDDIVVSKAWITCSDVLIRFCHKQRTKYFLSDCGVVRARDPHVRASLRYYFATKKVELVWAMFGAMDNLRLSYDIPMRPEYEKFKDQIGKEIYDQFVVIDKKLVDDELHDRFLIAVRTSGITNLLNLTLMT